MWGLSVFESRQQIRKNRLFVLCKRLLWKCQFLLVILLMFNLFSTVISDGIFELQLSSSSRNLLCDLNLYNGCQISICLQNKPPNFTNLELEQSQIIAFEKKNCDGFTTFDYSSQKQLNKLYRMDYKNPWQDDFVLEIEIRQIKTNKTFKRKLKSSTKINDPMSVLPIQINSFNSTIQQFQLDFEVFLEYKTKCQLGFYGSKCDKECRISGWEQEFAHFECGLEDGLKRCKSGWYGKNCSLKCDCIHGICDENTGKCICNSGYEGEKCEQCFKDKQCQGHCNKPFECICPPGKIGRFCEIDYNYCAKYKPCQNMGTCINLNISFVCKCKAGFFGKNCENRLKTCQPSSCQNNGQCVESPNNPQGFYCKCPPGIYGRYCQTQANTCRDRPCRSNSLTCSDQKTINTTDSMGFPELATFRCYCSSGWTGVVCDTPINWCPINACYNGGFCVQNSNTEMGYECHCPSSFHGSKCEKSIYPCQNNPCPNNTYCLNDPPHGFKCLSKQFVQNNSFDAIQQNFEIHSELNHKHEKMHSKSLNDFLWLSSAKIVCLSVLAIIILLAVLIFYVQKISRISEISAINCQQLPMSIVEFAEQKKSIKMPTNSADKFIVKNGKKYSSNLVNDIFDDEIVGEEQRYVVEPSLRPGPEAQKCLRAARLQQKLFNNNKMERSDDDIFCTQNSHRMFDEVSQYKDDTLMPPKFKQKHMFIKLDNYRDGVEDAERIYEEIDSIEPSTKSSRLSPPSSYSKHK